MSDAAILAVILDNKNQRQKKSSQSPGEKSRILGLKFFLKITKKQKKKIFFFSELDVIAL